MATPLETRLRQLLSDYQRIQSDLAGVIMDAENPAIVDASSTDMASEAVHSLSKQIYIIEQQLEKLKKQRKYRRNADVDYRSLERLYASQPTTENLMRLNTALERSGQEAYLPIPFMQNLVDNLLNAIYPTSKPLIRDSSLSWDGHHRGLKVNVYTYNLIYDEDSDFDEDEAKYTNAHITITMGGPFSDKPRDQGSVELEIYPDDVIYISYSFERPGKTLPLNQPWVYDAKALLEFLRSLWIDYKGWAISRSS